jgi:putative membrane protein
MAQLPDNSIIPTPLSSNELSADPTELAKYRSLAAGDRTLMAWIRTSLSLIGFGFGIPNYCPRDRYTYELSHSAEIVGVALLVIGLVSFIGVIVKSLIFLR